MTSTELIRTTNKKVLSMTAGRPFTAAIEANRLRNHDWGNI